MNRPVNSKSSNLVWVVIALFCGFNVQGIEYNVDLREELDSAKRSSAFINQFELDTSRTSRDAANEVNGYHLKKCSIINANLEVINQKTPATYLRFPIEDGRYIHARHTKSAETANGGSWEGQVLSQDGGRVAIFYNEKDQSITGFIETFTENPWNFRRYKDKHMICQDSGAPLNDTVIEVPPPDKKSHLNDNADSLSDAAFFLDENRSKEINQRAVFNIGLAFANAPGTQNLSAGTVNIANQHFSASSSGLVGFTEEITDTTVLANYTASKTLSNHLLGFRANGTFNSLRQANNGDLVIVVLKQSQVLPDPGQTVASCGAAFNPTSLSPLNRNSGIVVVGDNCSAFLGF